MRTVKMQGGLGNQLFCLGFAHTLARLTGKPVALDVASYGADRYGHHFDLAPLAERLGMPLVRRPLLASRAATAVMRGIRRGPYVSEGAAPTDEDAFRRGRYFNGYWQDEAYLSDAFREIARAFLLEQGGPGPSPDVVIHCRTYKEEVRPDRRAVPDRAWFLRCLCRLEGAHDIALISDDPALALARIGDVGHAIRPVTGGTAWTDMALMLRARALVLTNSTFSWWGGYCGEAETILYPPKGSLFHYAPPAARFTVVP
jgi:hypothetical protein